MEQVGTWSSTTRDLFKYHLKDDEENGNYTVDCLFKINTTWVQVYDDIRDKLQEIIEEGSNTKEDCTNPDKGVPMRLVIDKCCF